MLWFAVLSIIGTLIHVDTIDLPHASEQHKLHRAIVTHSAPAPYQYRILQPALVQLALDVSGAKTDSTTYSAVFLAGYAAIRCLSIFATLTAVFLALRLLWPDTMALLGSTILAAFLPFTYRFYFFQPTSILETALFGCALLAVLSRKPAAFLPLVLIGTFNRETACFIPLLYFLYWLPDLTRREWSWLICSWVAWGLIFVGLRMLWPTTVDFLSVAWCISVNMPMSMKSLGGDIYLAVMLSPYLFFLIWRRQASARYRRLALCSVPWLALHFLASRWWEIRFYMPMLIWLLPGLMSILSSDLEGTFVARSDSERPGLAR
jgi:hypothetical protein